MRRLLIRPGAIGDGLCWFPALHALRTDETEVWIRSELLSLLPGEVRGRSLASTGFSLLAVPGAMVPPPLVETLSGFDEILSWSGANQPALRQACDDLGLPIHFFPALPDQPGAVSDAYLLQTRAWHGLEEEPEGWRQPGGRRFLLPFLPARPQPEGREPLVVLHPYSGSAAKNWPLDSFRALAGALTGRARIRWCASPEDPLPNDLATGAWRFADLRELAFAFNEATLFVGNDSGMTHLAAMAGIPCTVFFGPMDPARWAPRGAELALVRTQAVGEAANAIPISKGIAATEALLGRVLSRALP